jgi:hypothetical protein
MTDTDPGTCGFCGRPLNAHDLHFRFRFPDVVAERLEAGLDLSEIAGDPDHDDAINVGDAWFVRVLLRIRLVDGARVTFGTWLEVDLEELRSVEEIWTTPEYVRVVLHGCLANAVPPWGDEVLGVPATATVPDVDQPPHVTASDDGLLSRVIDEVWSNDDVLAGLPH